MATVRCPSCDQALEVLEAYRDWTVRCPHCETEFVPDAVGTEVRRPPPRPRSRPRREEPDDRYGAGDDRRDRSDDRYDDDDEDDDRYDREEALRIVGPPAMWLEIVSWLSILLAIVLFGLCILLANAVNNNNPNGNNDEAVFWVFAGFCTSVLLVPYSVVMAIGARKMRTLSSREWALTACIMGIGAFVLFGICGLIQAGVGIWALVSLENPVVRDAFGVGYRRPRRRLRRRRDWED